MRTPPCFGAGPGGALGRLALVAHVPRPGSRRRRPVVPTTSSQRLSKLTPVQRLVEGLGHARERINALR